MAQFAGGRTRLHNLGHPGRKLVGGRGRMPPIQYIVEGGHRLSGAIEPSGNKNSALPIIAASLVTDHPVTLDTVPRISDTEPLVELIRSVGASAEWKGRNRLAIHAKD